MAFLHLPIRQNEKKSTRLWDQTSGTVFAKGMEGLAFLGHKDLVLIVCYSGHGLKDKLLPGV